MLLKAHQRLSADLLLGGVDNFSFSLCIYVNDDRHLGEINRLSISEKINRWTMTRQNQNRRIV